MKISGSYPFSVPPAQVWAAIYDPATLKACIPQCDVIERVRPDYWLGRAVVKIGPFKTSFEGEITLSEVTPPTSYSIAIIAKSWLGTAQGQAKVWLEAVDTGTHLHYEADVHIGIKLLDKAINLAQGMAKELADAFFGRLAEAISKNSSRDQVRSE